MTTYNTGNPVGSVAAKDLFDNAENFDKAVNGTEGTWVDRLGQTRKSIRGVEIETASAIQIGQATAIAVSTLHDTNAEGLAATPIGATFRVKGDGHIAAYEYKKLTEATYSLSAVYYSAEYVDALAKSALPVVYATGFSDAAPFAVGATALSGRILLDWPLRHKGFLCNMKTNAIAAGQVEVSTYSKSGNTFTKKQTTIVTVPSAGYHELPLHLKVDAGDYVLVYGNGGAISYSAGRQDGNGYRSGAAGDSFTQATVNTSARIRVAFDMVAFDEGVTSDEETEERLSYLEHGTKGQEVTQTISLQPPYASASQSLSSVATFIFMKAIERPGKITFSYLGGGAGEARLAMFRKEGATYIQTAVATVPITAGEHSVELPFEAVRGQFLSVRGTGMLYSSGISEPFISQLTLNFVEHTTPLNNVLIRAGFSIVGNEIKTGSGRPNNACLPWETMLVIGLGQSLMEGSQTSTSSTTPITTTQEYDNIGFPAYPAAPNVLLPATVANTQDNQRGEWPGLGAAASIRQALLAQNNIAYTDVKSTVAIANIAVGGTPIANMSKGTAQYNACLAAAAAVATISGGTGGVMAVIFGQGESDSNATAYLPAMKTLASDLDTDIRASNGQKKTVPFLAYQVSSANRPIALAQLQAARESPLITLVTPMYMLSYYDAKHIDSVSSRVLGGYYGRAVKEVAIDGVKWEPLWPVSCRQDGAVITMTFNKTGLVIDSSLMPLQVGSGFSVTGVTVTGVEVLNGNQVRLTLSGTPTAGAVVRYGQMAVGKGPFVGRAGNLRDNRGDSLKFDSFPLHNWCVEFDWIV